MASKVHEFLMSDLKKICFVGVVDNGELNGFQNCHQILIKFLNKTLIYWGTPAQIVSGESGDGHF